MPNIIQPQRHIAGKWTVCEPHIASAWLAIPAKGKPARFEVKRTAREYLAQCKRLAQPQRAFSFGARCPKRLSSGQLIVTSSRHDASKY